MRTTLRTGAVLLSVAALAFLSSGCGIDAPLLNPAFINTFTGEVFPRTPGPNAGFVLVQAVNETPETLEFIVTIDRDVLDIDDDGNPLLDANGEFLTHGEARRPTAAAGRGPRPGSPGPRGSAA